MRRIFTVTILAVCFLIPAAKGASGDIVVDLTPLEEFLDDAESEQTEQDDEASFHESSELFPEVETDKGTIEDLRDDRTAGFLVIRVGAREIVLRDVPLKDWYAPYVRAIAELQLVSGYRDESGMPTGLFGPADPVTLEQLAKVAVLAAGIDATSCPLTPKNLTSSGGWAAQYVSCAEMKSWAVYSDPVGDFRRPATREEVVMTILQAFDRPFDVEPTTIKFTDVEQTSMYARAIAKASSDGVVSGYTDSLGKPTGMFGPTNNVQRAEFAKIVSVVLQLYKK